MFKRISTASFLFLCVSMIIAGGCFAFVVLEKEDALKQVFFKGAEIEIETKELSDEMMEKITEKLGGSFVYTPEGSESDEVEESNVIDFYFASKGGKRLGVAIIGAEPGKWGPVTFITSMDLKGTVKVARVMSYEEVRGRPIAQRSYMNQYKGKNVNSSLTVGKDIMGVSGATISSRAATFAVKKALVLYKTVYGKK